MPSFAQERNSNREKCWPRLAFVIVLLLLLSACGTRDTEVSTATISPNQEDTPPDNVLHLTVATDATFPPMEFLDEDKEIAGFDIELLNAIAERQQLEITYKNTAWEDILSGLDSGEYDAVISAVTIEPELKEQYDFTDPYVDTGPIIVVRADEKDISARSDLERRTIGIRRDSVGATVVDDIQGSEIKEFETIDRAFVALRSGALDAVVVDLIVAADFAVISDQFGGELEIVGKPLTEEPCGVVVRKGEQTEFVRRFNEGLRQIKDDGTYDKIYTRWLLGDSALQAE